VIRVCSLLLCLRALLKNISAEFSGTLLGFDDYVSEYSKLLSLKRFSNDNTDMVLEDVTELYVD
jgi:hypothetical protein